jgi:wyosine [tRNA(Phe)-imidazoG37] synthetase (radical SAM superfamily)
MSADSKREGSPRYLFGPVPSRRLGRSLGIDLIPLKTCSFNCLFCQLGRTAAAGLTLERREYALVAEVVAEFDAWLAAGGTADTVTLAGSGEPTLHSRFGEVIDAAHARCPVRTALLTNSSLMSLPEVREAAARSDLVKVSLSAWDQASFLAINRPHPALVFAEIAEGLRLFRQQFTGELWMEVFVVAGLNDTIADMRRIAALAEPIRPDHIHLNTAVRPPAEATAGAVAADRLAQLAAVFTPPAEVIASFQSDAVHHQKAGAGDILAMVGRHPCTAVDIMAAFGLSAEELDRCLRELLRSGKVRTQSSGGRRYFVGS